MDRLRLVPACLLLLIAAQAVRAQTLPDISTLPAAASLDAAQSQQIEQWAAAAAAIIQSGDSEGLTQLRSRVATLCSASATPAFRDAMADALVKHCGPILGAGKPAQSQAVVAVVSNTRSSRGVAFLVGALSSNDVGARFIAAQGLSELKGDFGSDTAGTIDGIRQALLSESNPAVAAQLARAIGVPAQPDASAQGIAELIKRRTDRFRQSGLGDLHPVYSALLALDNIPLSQIPAANRPPLVAAVADLLEFAVRTALSNAKLDDKSNDGLERIIDRAEPVLAKLLAGNTPPENLPSVADKMRTGGDEKAAAMQAELDKWLGAGADSGILNSPPWSLPIGGGFAAIN